MFTINQFNVNVKDARGKTRLHRACQDGNLAVAEELVKTGADINATDLDGNTPLNSAAHSGHWHVVQWLVGVLKADVTHKNANGTSALHQAAYWGDVPIVEWLLSEGLDPSAPGKHGKTPLVYAAEHGHTAVVRILEGAVAFKTAPKDFEPLLARLELEQPGISFKLRDAYKQLQAMGYVDDGLLLRLVIAKNGNINAVLDIFN